MKTVNLFCQTCEQDKEEKDFYWKTPATSVNKVRREHDCKKCISERGKKLREEKKKEFLY